MLKKVKIALLITLLCAGSSFAARPFSVEDSGVLEKGLELELSYSGSTKGDVVEKEKAFVLSAALIPEVLQLGYERAYTDAPYFPWGDGDSIVSLKYGFLGNQALKGSVSMVDGDEKNGFGNEYTEYGLTYAIDHAFGPVTVYSNVGYTTYNWGDWYEEDVDEEGNETKPEVQNNWNAGLGVKYDLFDNFALCLEATKMIVQGDYLGKYDGYVNGMVGFVWTVGEVPVDFSYASTAGEAGYVYSLGTTLAF